MTSVLESVKKIAARTRSPSSRSTSGFSIWRAVDHHRHQPRQHRHQPCPSVSVCCTAVRMSASVLAYSGTRSPYRIRWTRRSTFSASRAADPDRVARVPRSERLAQLDDTSRGRSRSACAAIRRVVVLLVDGDLLLLSVEAQGPRRSTPPAATLGVAGIDAVAGRRAIVGIWCGRSCRSTRHQHVLRGLRGGSSADRRDRDARRELRHGERRRRPTSRPTSRCSSTAMWTMLFCIRGSGCSIEDVALPSSSSTSPRFLPARVRSRPTPPAGRLRRRAHRLRRTAPR